MLPPVRIISMPNSARINECMQSWQALFPDVRVFPAINGKDVTLVDRRLSVDLSDRIRSLNILSRLSWDDNGNYIRSKPAIGCALSHIAAWKMVIDAQTPMIIVEDDTVLKTRDAALISNSIADEQLVFLVTRIVQKQLVRESRGFWGMNAYYVTPSAAEVLVEYAFPLNMHIDRYIHMLAMRLDLDWSILVPSIPYALIGSSTLEHSIGKQLRMMVAMLLICIIIILAGAYNSCRIRCTKACVVTK